MFNTSDPRESSQEELQQAAAGFVYMHRDGRLSPRDSNVQSAMGQGPNPSLEQSAALVQGPPIISLSPPEVTGANELGLDGGSPGQFITGDTVLGVSQPAIQILNEQSFVQCFDETDRMQVPDIYQTSSFSIQQQENVVSHNQLPQQQNQNHVQQQPQETYQTNPPNFVDHLHEPYSHSRRESVSSSTSYHQPVAGGAQLSGSPSPLLAADPASPFVDDMLAFKLNSTDFSGLYNEANSQDFVSPPVNDMSTFLFPGNNINQFQANRLRSKSDTDLRQNFANYNINNNFSGANSGLNVMNNVSQQRPQHPALSSIGLSLSPEGSSYSSEASYEDNLSTGSTTTNNRIFLSIDTSQQPLNDGSGGGIGGTRQSRASYSPNHLSPTIDNNSLQARRSRSVGGDPRSKSPTRPRSRSKSREYMLDLATAQPQGKRQKHPSIFACHLCDKKFTRAYNLRSHLRTHTDERPFVCTICGKAFARQHDRKRHEALHTGEKKFECLGVLSDGKTPWGCGRKFARADALGRHFRTEGGRECIRPLLEEEERFKQSGVRGHNGNPNTNNTVPLFVGNQATPSVMLSAPGAPNGNGEQQPVKTEEFYYPPALLAQYPGLLQVSSSNFGTSDVSDYEDERI